MHALAVNALANSAAIKLVHAPGSTMMDKRPSGNLVMLWYANASGHQGYACKLLVELKGVAKLLSVPDAIPEPSRGVAMFNSAACNSYVVMAIISDGARHCGHLVLPSV